MTESVQIVQSIDDAFAKGDVPFVLGAMDEQVEWNKRLRAARAVDLQVAHVWDLRDGKVVRWQQYMDTWQAAQVMGVTPKA